MAAKVKVTHKIHVKRGDTVVVLTGKNKGKKGKVLTVIPDKGRVVVEGVNIIKKHTRPNPAVMQGGIIEQEAPIASSNVMLFCEKCNAPRRIRHAERRRVCVKCGTAFEK